MDRRSFLGALAGAAAATAVPKLLPPPVPELFTPVTYHATVAFDMTPEAGEIFRLIERKMNEAFREMDRLLAEKLYVTGHYEYA